jgi:transposase
MRLISMSQAATTTVKPPISADDLPDDPATLKNMVVELLAAMQQRDSDIEGLRHRVDLLLRRLYGPRCERFDPNQRLLFPDEQTGEDTPLAAPPAEAKPKRKCRPHGRRKLPENLPRVLKQHELTAAERICSCCGHERQEIGTETSEQLDYRPASLFVVAHIIHKYLCPCCSKARQDVLPPGSEAPPVQKTTQIPETPSLQVPSQSASAEASEPMTKPTESSSSEDRPREQETPAAECQGVPQPAPLIIAATKPAGPIAKGMALPGLLAHLIVSKYEDHLPLYRLERIYERQGVFLPRSTLCDWLLASARLLRPLYDRLVYWALLSGVLHTDDTPVDLQDPKTHLLSTARLWVYLGDAAHPYNVFDFTPNRKRDGPQLFLAGFQGYLQADAFSGYDCLYLPDPLTSKARIIEVACNAHARRKFFEAQKTDAVRSIVALGYYRQLYELERQAKEFSEEQRRQMRQDLAVPILKSFREWIDKAYQEVLPKSPMAEALGYARNNWSALVRYAETGFLDIDNNVAEREMKRIAIGRKNWLFLGSREGGKMAAVMMSFTSTCRRLGVEPWEYLQDVLIRLPTTPADQLDELLPDRWQAAKRVKNEASLSSAPGTTLLPPRSDN